jgi:cell division protein FtsB
MSAVQPRTFEERLAMLEKQMAEMRELPARVTNLESQIVQLRQEMRDEFSAIRHELKAADDDTRVFMRILHEDVLTRIRVTGEGHDTGGKGR